MTAERKELAERLESHANRITKKLENGDWYPDRAHIAEARNNLKKAADMLERIPDPVGPDYVLISRRILEDARSDLFGNSQPYVTEAIDAALAAPQSAGEK